MRYRLVETSTYYYDLTMTYDQYRSLILAAAATACCIRNGACSPGSPSCDWEWTARRGMASVKRTRAVYPRQNIIRRAPWLNTPS